MQEDVRRLAAAQERLERFSRDRFPLDDSANGNGRRGGDGYVLPPLPVGSGSAARSAALDRQAAQARAELRQSAARQIEEFSQNLERRQKRVIEQRRAELETQNRFALAAAERRARQDADLRTREQLESASYPYLNLVIKRDALESSIDILPPILDEETYQKELETLKTNPDAPNISDRARLETRLRDISARLNRLIAQMEGIQEQGRSAAAEAVARAQALAAAEIERALDELRNDVESQRIVEAQRGEVARMLREAEEIATEARRNASGLLLSNRGTAATGAFSVNAPLLSGTAAAGRTDIRTAIERLTRQREKLLRFIRADVAAQVRDIAAARNIDVFIVEGTGALVAIAPPGDTQERQDMTERFGQWIAAGPSWEKGLRL